MNKMKNKKKKNPIYINIVILKQEHGKSKWDNNKVEMKIYPGMYNDNIVIL